MFEGQNARIKLISNSDRVGALNSIFVMQNLVPVIVVNFVLGHHRQDTCGHFEVDFLMAADLQAFCLWALSDGVADGNFGVCSYSCEKKLHACLSC